MLKKRREEMLEAVSEYDDILLDKFLHEKTVEAEDIIRAIRKAVIKCALVPVLCGSSFRNRGMQKLLDAIVDYLPSPIDLPPVTGIFSRWQKRITAQRPIPPSRLRLWPSKFTAIPTAGRLCYLRIYSGTIKPGCRILNPNSGIKERVSRILQMHSNKRADVEVASAGDIVAVIGLRKTTTGDTLCDPKHPIVLEMMKFPEPVIFVAIEPVRKRIRISWSDALQKLAGRRPHF